MAADELISGQRLEGKRLDSRERGREGVAKRGWRKFYEDFGVQRRRFRENIKNGPEISETGDGREGDVASSHKPHARWSVECLASLCTPGAWKQKCITANMAMGNEFESVAAPSSTATTIDEDIDARVQQSSRA